MNDCETDIAIKREVNYSRVSDMFSGKDTGEDTGGRNRWGFTR